VITAAEADVLASQRALAAAVVRVDDFAQDLGASLLRPIDGARGSAPDERERCEVASAMPSTAVGARADATRRAAQLTIPS
jgi:hypothetical protein